ASSCGATERHRRPLRGVYYGVLPGNEVHAPGAAHHSQVNGHRGGPIMAQQDQAQTSIHDAIQAQAPFEGSRLVGWTIVAEWRTTDDERKLARLNSKDASHWQVSGYLHEALFGEEEG